MLSLRCSVLIGQVNIKLKIVRFGSFKNVKIINKSADWLPMKGEESGKKPIRMKLEAGKQYLYCACGLSANDPWCDNVCNTYGFTTLRHINFTVDKSDEYSLCTCKKTNSRPICDGSHKFISQKPKHAEATQFFAIDENTSVYEGVARELGYRSKNGYQQ